MQQMSRTHEADQRIDLAGVQQIDPVKLAGQAWRAPGDPPARPRIAQAAGRQHAMHLESRLAQRREAAPADETAGTRHQHTPGRGHGVIDASSSG